MDFVDCSKGRAPLRVAHEEIYSHSAALGKGISLPVASRRASHLTLGQLDISRVDVTQAIDWATGYKEQDSCMLLFG